MLIFENIQHLNCPNTEEKKNPLIKKTFKKNFENVFSLSFCVDFLIQSMGKIKMLC